MNSEMLESKFVLSSYKNVLYKELAQYFGGEKQNTLKKIYYFAIYSIDQVNELKFL